MQQDLLDADHLDVVHNRRVELFDDRHGPVNVIDAGHISRNDGTAIQRHHLEGRQWQLGTQDTFDLASVRQHDDVDRVQVFLGVPQVELCRPWDLGEDLDLVLRNGCRPEHFLVVHLELGDPFLQS